jgi:2-hydroxychromene-2-carboxylate isomerase
MDAVRASLRLVPAAAPGAAGEPAAIRSPTVACATGVIFFFELGCPASYLAAERVERAFGHVRWVPTAQLAGARRRDASALAELLALAAREAASLRLPLIVPERFGAEFLPARRAAAFAAANGGGGRFALAASRLAFCGGYDIDTRVVLTEAARAAGLSVPECLEAAADPRWDESLYATASELEAVGVDTGPAIRIGLNWFHGLGAVSDAAAFSALSALREVAP